MKDLIHQLEGKPEGKLEGKPDGKPEEDSQFEYTDNLRLNKESGDIKVSS